MKTILIASILITLACPLTRAASRFPLPAFPEIHQAYALVQDDTNEEDVPFDDTDGEEDGIDFVLNWGAKLFLWFIYLMLGVLVLGATFWSLTAKGFWAWAACMFAAFCYAMLLGRYWGYGACLIGFVIIFAIARIVIHSAWFSKKFKNTN